MYKTKPTRREAKTIPPEGGIFLCPEHINPETIANALSQLNRDRNRSIRAQAILKVARADWEDRQERGEVRSYGKELEDYVRERSKNPGERATMPENARAVERIEQLCDESSLFMGARDGIRSMANRVSTHIAEQLELGEKAVIGLHQYGRVLGPFGHEFLSRIEPDSETQILFDWGGELDGQLFAHAKFSDQVVLLSDVMIHHNETRST